MASDLRTAKNQAPMPVSSPAASELAKASVASRAPSGTSGVPKSSFSDELVKADGGSNRAQNQAKTARSADDRPATKTTDDANDKDLTARADQTAKDAGNDTRTKQAVARKNLTPLKKAIDEKPEAKEAVENTPVLAFLSGHLEKLQPSAIPSLLAENEFISDAMSQVDVGEFLNRPTTVQDLLSALDLPDTVLDEAKGLGLDLSTIVSPSDIFRALGLDPNRVMVEIKQLRDNLPTSGLAPYLQRAAAMRATVGAVDFDKRDLRAGTPLDPALDAQREFQRRGPAVPAVPTNLGAMPGVQPNMAQGPQVPQSSNQGSSGRPSALAVTSGALSPFGIAAPAAPVSLELNYLKQLTDVAPMPDMQPSSANLGLVSPQLPVSDLAASQPAMPLNPAALTTSNVPKMNAATFDSFAVMNYRLLATDGVVSKDFSKAIEIAPESAALNSSGSIDEQLMSDALANQAPGLVSSPAQAPLPEALRAMDPNAASLASLLKSQSNLASTQQHMMGQILKPEQLNGRADTLKSMDETVEAGTDVAGLADVRAAMSFDNTAVKKPSLATARPVEELQLKMPVMHESVRDMHGGGQAFSDQSSEKGEGDSRDSSSGFDMMTQGVQHLGGHAKASVTSSFDLAGTNHRAEVGLTAQQRADFVQKVIDQATAAIKDGQSGTVHIDFGSKELGKLEMAISMKDDKVDLKIMTASDRTRDLLAGEMGRLKDALIVQNVQLGRVDVGVGRGQTGNFQGFANQNGQGGFNGNAFANGQGFSDGRQAFRDVMPRSESLTPRLSATRAKLGGLGNSNNYGQSYSQSGRLEVRA